MARGPSKKVREKVIYRDRESCRRCGRWADGGSIHHRRPRGMGGTSDPVVNLPANLVLLCGSGTTGCHGWVEANRVQAREDGWLVPMGVDPADVPVRCADGVLFLTNEGLVQPYTDVPF